MASVQRRILEIGNHRSPLMTDKQIFFRSFPRQHEYCGIVLPRPIEHDLFPSRQGTSSAPQDDLTSQPEHISFYSYMRAREMNGQLGTFDEAHMLFVLDPLLFSKIIAGPLFEFVKSCLKSGAPLIMLAPDDRLSFEREHPHEIEDYLLAHGFLVDAGGSELLTPRVTPLYRHLENVLMLAQPKWGYSPLVILAKKQD